MIGRLAVLGFVLGGSLVHGLATLPSLGWVGLAVLPGVLAGWLGYRADRRVPAAANGDARRRPGQGPVTINRLGGVPASWMAAGALLWLAACAGFAWTAMQAADRLREQLADINVNQVVRADLRVVGLPRLQADRRQFEAEVLSAHPAGVPRRVLISWAAPGWRGPYAAVSEPEESLPDVVPGQVWRMALVMRPVWAAMNLHAFDYERHAFAQGIRATGTVRGTPHLLDDNAWASLEVLAQRARHVVREAMRPHLEGMRYGPVLLALAIGDQDGVSDQDWRVFNRTGITHLVSISGSHITMIAAFAGVATFVLWRRVRWHGKVLAEALPAQIAAAWAALLVAWLYCLLAGWGVPARRTFMMLAVVAVCHALRLRLGGWRILALAAMVVLILDPWAVLASGFWLSFGAVAVLLAISTQAEARPKPATTSLRTRLRQGLSLAVRAQMAVTLALMPPLAWMFHEISVVSPLANSYAIPVIGWIVTPLSLLAAASAMLPGAGWLAHWLALVGHGVLYAMMQPTEWLGALPAAQWAVAAAPLALNLLACGGVVLALWPSRWRWRRLGWAAMLPLLLWVPPGPREGEWELHALDVGQGSALVLRTARRVLVFDAGARRSAVSDEGARTVLPFLKAHGIGVLDVLAVSHGDVDHAGGLRSLLEGMAVMQSYSSFPLDVWLRREARKLGLDPPRMPQVDGPCRYGHSWRVDGVSFEFLWPLDQADADRRRKPDSNASSCVLRVRGAHHTLLLTGDVDAASEAVLLDRGLGSADVVVAAHHGSATSSSQAWVDRLQAAHVIVQAGSWNRYGHPAAAVVARWARAGAQLWRTDRDGAIVAHSHSGGLRVYSVLESSRRYWHGRRLQ